MLIMLSQPERDRFADWYEQDARAILGLVEQMAKLPNMEAIMKVKRTEAMAQQVVAKMLRSTEDF